MLFSFCVRVCVFNFVAPAPQSPSPLQINPHDAPVGTHMAEFTATRQQGHRMLEEK